MKTISHLVLAFATLSLAACGAEPRDNTVPAGDGGVAADGGGAFDGGSMSMMIGPAGGMLQLGSTKLTVPSGAVTAPVMITIAEVNPSTLAAVPSGYVANGPVLAFLPHGTTFQMPVTIEVPYNPTTDTQVLRHLDNEADTTWSDQPNVTFQNGVARTMVTSFCLKQACRRSEGPTSEICNNERDDDGDTMADCADSDCATAANCVSSSENCNNNVDDDGDGLIDCQDVQNCCASRPICCELNSACFELNLCGG